MQKFVRVKFSNSYQMYDYMCNFIDIKKGDYVYVPTKDGKDVVLVCGVFYSNLEDMPLASNAYKKVLGRYVASEAVSSNEKNKAAYANEDRKKKSKDKIYITSVENKNSMSEEVYINKEETGTKNDIIGLIIIIVYFAITFWLLFSDDFKEARALYYDFNRDFPQKEYWRP